MSHTQTVQDLYAAFGRGDVAAILNLVTDDVDWNNDRVASRECPWNGNFSGKARVTDFFKAVDELDITVFEPRIFTESGNHVSVMLRIESRVKKNGQSLQNDSIHLWTFNDNGKISAYRHFNDTAAELAAWRA